MILVLLGEHGHEEHGLTKERIKRWTGRAWRLETLETIFTVIGGLVLLSAHFINIRLINKST